MKANYVEFVTKLPIEEIGAIFTNEVRRRPLKLKIFPFRSFTPESANGIGEAPDREFGTMFTFHGSDPMMGSVVLICKKVPGGTAVILRSTGNVRGRGISNGLQRHLLAAYRLGDPGIQPTDETVLR